MSSDENKSSDLFEFKTPQAATRAKMLVPKLIDIMAEMYSWAVERNLPFVVTETVTTEKEDLALKRTSTSHRERRAFDLSTSGWSFDQCREFVEHFNFKHADVAAIAAATGKPTLVVFGDSRHLDHFHVQIHQRFKFILHS